MASDEERFDSGAFQGGDMRRDWDVRAALCAREYIVSGLGHSVEEFAASGRYDAKHLSQFCNEKSVVLDLGCGIGRVSGPLEHHVKQILAVDVSEEMIRQAQAYVGPESRIQFYVNDGGTLGMIATASVDFAFSLLTLHHVSRATLIGYLAELHRVLSSNGCFYFSILVNAEPDNILDDTRDTFAGRSYPESVISEWLSGRFEVVRQFYPHGVANGNRPLRVEYLIAKITSPSSSWSQVPDVTPSSIRLDDLDDRH